MFGNIHFILNKKRLIIISISSICLILIVSFAYFYTQKRQNINQFKFLIDQRKTLVNLNTKLSTMLDKEEEANNQLGEDLEEEAILTKEELEAELLREEARQFEEEAKQFKEEYVQQILLLKSRLSDMQATKELLPIKQNLILISEVYYKRARDIKITQKDIDEVLVAEQRVKEEIDSIIIKWNLNSKEFNL